VRAACSVSTRPAPGSPPDTSPATLHDVTPAAIFFSRKTTTTKRLERWRTAEFGLEPDVEQWRLCERVQAGGERRVLLRARHVSARHQSRVRPFEQLSANMRLCVCVRLCIQMAGDEFSRERPSGEEAALEGDQFGDGGDEQRGLGTGGCRRQICPHLGLHAFLERLVSNVDTQK
jgi:hypothetical protein